MRLYKMNGVFAAFFVLCGIGLACELLPGEGTVSKALQFSVASNLQKQKLHEVDVERKASISFMKDLQTVEEFQKKLEVHLAEILPMPTVLVAMIAQYCKPLTFALKKKWKASEHGIFTVSCSSDGKMFASAGSGGAVTFWDMHTLQKLKSMSRPDGRQVCFSTFLSPNSFLLSGDEGGDAYMGDYDKEQFVATMGLDGGKLLNVSCPAKKQIYIKSFGAVKMYAMEIGYVGIYPWWLNTVQSSLKGHGCPAESAASSPDGEQVVSGAFSGAHNNSLKLWNVATGKELHAFRDTAYTGEVAWSPNGKFIVSEHYFGTVNVWDAITKELMYQLREISYGWRVPIIVSPDSSSVVLTEDRNDKPKSVKVWNLESESMQALPIDRSIKRYGHVSVRNKTDRWWHRWYIIRVGGELMRLHVAWCYLEWCWSRLTS